MRLGAGAPAGAKALLSHNLDGELQFRLVSRAVNSVRNPGAECDLSLSQSDLPVRALATGASENPFLHWPASYPSDPGHPALPSIRFFD